MTTAMLLETTSATYLRRLAREINRRACYGDCIVSLSDGQQRRVRAAKLTGGLLHVRTIGSDTWFATSADGLSGVLASRSI